MAEIAAVFWQRVAVQLEPVIAPSGVAALNARCVHLCLFESCVPDTAMPSLPNTALFAPVWYAVASHPSPRDAIDAGVAFFATFTRLLASLIGAALTARLLNPVWAEGPPDQPVQEHPR